MMGAFLNLPVHDLRNGAKPNGCKQTEWLFKGKSPI